MSETTNLGREPVEIIEMVLPRCANTFGCGPCKAGLGTVDESNISRYFAERGDGTSYTVGNGSLSEVDAGVRITGAGAGNSNVYFTSNQVGTGFDGDTFRYIVVCGKIITEDGDASFEFTFSSDGAAPDQGNFTKALNDQKSFRNIPALAALTDGDEFIAVFDAADHPEYATDWQGSTVDWLDVRITTGDNTVYDISSIQVCSDSLIDKVGSECFETRATCQDVDNFHARPLTYLSPSQQYVTGDTVVSTDFDRTLPVIFETDVEFPAEPTGTIYEQGGSGFGTYLGFTGGNLIWRAFEGSPATTSETADIAYISIDESVVAGRSITLIMTINNPTIELWEFDPVEFTLTRLGTSTASNKTGFALWAGLGDGKIGDSDGVPTGEDGGEFNGRITRFNGYGTSRPGALTRGTDAYRFRYFFDDGRKAVPKDDIYIVPLLKSASAVGSRLNITGSDDRYEPIGRRAIMNVMFADAPHSDFLFDPYVTSRPYDPLARSTFWAKWQIRNKFGRTRAIIRRYTGYNRDALADMRSQTYVIDKTAWRRNSFQIGCRDILSLTEFRKAQVPAASTGALSADIDSTQTTISLTGDVTDEYPSTGGTLRINDELMTYTGRTYDSTLDITNVTGLTRGTDGSDADDHSIDDNVQLCRRYTEARIDDVLEEIIVTDAQVPAQLVNLSRFTSEYDTYLDAYLLTTVISEPTGVDRLIGELAEQCAFYVWWNERDQLVDLRALRALDVLNRSLTQEADIIGDTFNIEERPKERVSTISIYYNPRDFAGDLEKPANFANQLIFSNAQGSDPDQYAKLPQTREIFSRWLVSQNVVNQTAARYSRRYVDIPQYVTLLVDAKDRDLWVGDFTRLEHDFLVLDDGSRDTDRNWLVIEAEEVVAGHRQKLTLVDVTLDGKVYFITENTIGTYTEEAFADRNAFITDNNGLNPDGSRGATIS